MSCQQACQIHCESAFVIPPAVSPIVAPLLSSARGLALPSILHLHQPHRRSPFTLDPVLVFPFACAYPSGSVAIHVAPIHASKPPNFDNIDTCDRPRSRVYALVSSCLGFASLGFG
ncbi:hypothetical protein IG631_06214 [Alternaria alternata]|nr:hypothetical protein IG631_06214 [Alternaria alternata]